MGEGGKVVVVIEVEVVVVEDSRVVVDRVVLVSVVVVVIDVSSVDDFVWMTWRVVVVAWGREIALLHAEMIEPVAYSDSADGVANEGWYRLRIAATLVVTIALAVITTRSETVDTTDNVVLVVSVIVFVRVVKIVTIEVSVAVLTGTGYCRTSEQKD